MGVPDSYYLNNYFNKLSAAQSQAKHKKQEKTVFLNEVESDTSDIDKTQNWLPAVEVSVIAMYCLAYFAKFNSPGDVTGVLCFCHTIEPEMPIEGKQLKKHANYPSSAIQ